MRIEVAAAEQRVEADEAGAGDGASPLNPAVLCGSRVVRSHGVRMARRSALASLVVASLLTGGCMFLRVGAGYLGVDGHVYEALGATRASASVAVDTSDAPVPGAVHGVEGCSVMVMPWKPKDPGSGYSLDLWTRRGGVTDADGHFTVGGTSAPGFYDATLSVTCQGFQPLTHVFRHDRLRHTAIVTLVRESAPASERPHNNEMQRTKPAQAMELRR